MLKKSSDIYDTFLASPEYLLWAHPTVPISVCTAKKHPNWFYAYIGVGQMSNMLEHVVGEYDLLVDYAKREMIVDVGKAKCPAPYPSPDATARQIFLKSHFIWGTGPSIGKILSW